MKKLVSLLRSDPGAREETAKSISESSSGKTLVGGSHDSAGTRVEGDRLYEMYAPADDVWIDIDVVAVHGLMGNPFTTWTKGKDPNGIPWIADLLPSELPHSRVFSYGYDSNFVRSSSVAGIPEFAMNLLAWLKLKRSTEREKQRPLLFICHSLGGIITKKAMIIANNRKDDEFLRAVKGIAFLGVPHHGSGVVELGKYVAYLLRSLSRKINSDLLADLNTRSRVLNSICVDATHLICQLRIITFYETRKFPGLGRLIVDEDSARLNCPNEEVIPINTDHSSICKFERGDANAELIGGLIVGLATQIIGPPAPPPPPPALSEPAVPPVIAAVSQAGSASNGSEPSPPGRLTVHIAMWSDLDVTELLRSQIQTADQTLAVDTTHGLNARDPWFGVHKVTSVLYSYGDGPFQLLVTHDGVGVSLIHRGRVEPAALVAPGVERRGNTTADHLNQSTHFEIIAVVWGTMHGRFAPVDEATMMKIYNTGRVECTNAFFGFDGFSNRRKTCQVFYRVRKDPRQIRCLVGREGTTITMPHRLS